MLSARTDGSSALIIRRVCARTTVGSASRRASEQNRRRMWGAARADDVARAATRRAVEFAAHTVRPWKAAVKPSSLGSLLVPVVVRVRADPRARPPLDHLHRLDVVGLLSQLRMRHPNEIRRELQERRRDLLLAG